MLLSKSSRELCNLDVLRDLALATEVSSSTSTGACETATNPSNPSVIYIH